MFFLMENGHGWIDKLGMLRLFDPFSSVSCMFPVKEIGGWLPWSTKKIHKNF